jgi:hypothetical protein
MAVLSTPGGYARLNCGHAATLRTARLNRILIIYTGVSANLLDGFEQFMLQSVGA